jgi:hypothetical protein
MLRMVMVAFLAMAEAASAGCLIGCPPNDEVPAAEAGTRFAEATGLSLSAGTRLVGMIDGGFQDRFIQVKLSADEAGAAKLLDALGLTEAAFGSPDGSQLTIAEASWWDVEAHPGLVLAPVKLDGFAYGHLARTRDPDEGGRWLFYLLAFQT